MKIKIIISILIVVFTIGFFVLNKFLVANTNNQNHRYMPKDGFVPDKETAIRIAEVILLPIYDSIIENEKPFVAYLKDSTIWVVQGTLKTTRGGVAYIEIQKSDCKILKVTHGK